MSTEPELRWSLSREALERLLQRLDPDPEAAGREYAAVRRRLVAFFDLKGLATAATLADETLDRVARKLEQGEAIAHLKAYLYGVAQRVALEGVRREARERTALAAHRPTATSNEPSDADEASVACLQRCLATLPPQARGMIVAYYEGPGQSHQEGRKLLARSLGISYASLKTRAHRIRVALEDCLRDCLELQKEALPTTIPRHSRVSRP